VRGGNNRSFLTIAQVLPLQLLVELSELHQTVAKGPLQYHIVNTKGKRRRYQGWRRPSTQNVTCLRTAFYAYLSKSRSQLHLGTAAQILDFISICHGRSLMHGRRRWVTRSAGEIFRVNRERTNYQAECRNIELLKLSIILHK
jgi:hypothetical protein